MKKIISSNPTRIKSSIIVASKFKMNKNKNQSNNFDNSYITIVNNSDTEEKNKNEDFLSNAHNNITKILSGFINDFEEEDENENYIKKDTIKNVKKIIEKKNRISFANDIKNNKNSSNKSIKKIIRKSKKQHTVKLPPSKLNISLQQIENDIKDNLNQEKKELKKSLIINNNDFHDVFNLSIDQSHENLLKKDNFNSNRNLKSFSKHVKNILKNNNNNNNNEINNNNNNNINNNNNNNEINKNNNNNNNNNNISNYKSSNLLHIQKQRSFNKNKNRFLKSFKKSSSINQTNLFSAKKQLKKFSLNEIKKSNTPKKNENRRNTISNILLKNLPKRISKNLDNIFFPQNSIKSTKKTIDILNINGLTNKNILELNDIKNKLKNEIIGNETNFNSNSNNNKNIKNSLIKTKEFFSDKDLNKENFNNNNKKLIEFRYRKLFIKKLVYDSLDDSEIESEEIETFFIYPFSIYNIIIDFLVSLFAIFDLIYTPLNLSYLNNYCKETEFNFDNIYNFIIEILYIIDLIKSFFVAYFNFEEILIENLNEIIIHYLSDWFFFDLLASIPIQNIFLITINQCSITNTNDFDVTFVGNNKYIYIFVLLRQIKIFKIFSFNSFMLKFRIFLSKLESSSNYGKIFMSLFIFFIALHYIACIFIFIGKNYYPNWIVKNNLQSNNFIDLYITSIYFMIATLTTVGYGDISTYNIWEKIFGLIMLLIGILGYSYAISSLSNYIKNIDAKNLEYEKKCSILEEIKLIHPEIPDDLNDRILRYLKYKQFNEKKDKNIIMECLPNSLRNTLIYNMYRNIIENFIFFKNFKNTEFIVRVILKFKPILALKNDVLVKQGEFIEEIIFVKNGKLSLCISINKNIYQKATLNTISKLSSSLVSSQQLKSIQTRTYHLDDFTYSNTKTFRNNFEEDENQDENVDILKILEIRKNEHFGDILMFLNKRSPLSVKAKTKYCELFYLNKTDAVEISTSFPLIWRKINKISLFNMEQIKRLINKVIKIYYSVNGIENNDNNNNKVLTTIVSQYSKNSEEDDESELQSIPSSFTETTLSNIYQNNKNFMKFSGLKSKKNSKNNFDDEEDESSGYSDYVNNNNINNNNNNNNNSNEKKNVVLKRSKKSILLRKKSISILNDINNNNENNNNNNNNNNENNNNSFKLSLESINDNNNNNNNNKPSHKEKFSISINDSKTLDNIKEKENESDSSSMVNTSNNNIFSNNFTNNNNNSNRSDRSNKSYSIFSQKTTKINVNNTNTIDFSETNSVSDKNDQFNNFNDNNNNNNVKKTPFQPNEINQETYSNEEVIEKNDLIHLNKNYNEINLNNNKKEETLISFSSMTNKEPFFNNFSNQFKDFFDKNKIIFNENNNNNINNKNNNNNKNNKENKNIFIFSNEININLNSSYENINTLSNFTYIKDKNLQNKIKNILTNKETINNNNNNNNNKTNNDNNDKNDNEIFIRNINKSSTNKSESPKLFSKRKTQILNSNTLINYPRHNSIQKNKHYFKSFSIIPEYNNEMFKSNRKNNNNNNNNENNENNVINLIPMNNNSSNKKSKNLLNVISQNIKRNNMNLNNPDEFYSEYFSNIINKTSIKKEKKV